MEPTTLVQLLKNRFFDLQYLTRYKCYVVRIYLNVGELYKLSRDFKVPSNYQKRGALWARSARAKRGKILLYIFGLIEALALFLNCERGTLLSVKTKRRVLTLKYCFVGFNIVLTF